MDRGAPSVADAVRPACTVVSTSGSGHWAALRAAHALPQGHASRNRRSANANAPPPSSASTTNDAAVLRGMGAVEESGSVRPPTRRSPSQAMPSLSASRLCGSPGPACSKNRWASCCVEKSRQSRSCADTGTAERARTTSESAGTTRIFLMTASSSCFLPSWPSEVDLSLGSSSRTLARGVMLSVPCASGTSAIRRTPYAERHISHVRRRIGQEMDRVPARVSNMLVHEGSRRPRSR